MKKLLRSFVIVLLVVFALGIGLQAQEVSLEEVAANSSDYYGQQLTLTGTIENFLSPHIFILGEDSLLDNDQVLVINRSGQVLPLMIAEGSFVTVSGTIYPSRSEWSNGTFAEGFTDFVIDPEVGSNNYYGSLRGMSPNAGTNAGTNTGQAGAEATADAMGQAGAEATADVMGQTSMVGDWGSFDVDTTSFYYNGWFLEDYADYTVLVLTDVNSVLVTPEEQ
jgi:hypothetical protein